MADDDEPDPLFEVFQIDETETVVADMIDLMLDRALEQIRENELDKKVVPYSVRRNTNDIMNVVKWYFLDCDAGEPSWAINPTWQPDDEPVAARTDSWSRGAVPNKKKIYRDQPSVTPGDQSTQSQESSSRQGGSRGGAKPKKKASMEEKPSPLVELENEQPKMVITKAPPKPVAKVEQEPPSKEMALKLRQEAQYREEQEMLEKLHTELKGRDYTYDHNGNVIVIQNVDPDKLPPYSFVPRVDVFQEEEVEPKNRGGKKGKKGEKRAANKIDKRAIKLLDQEEFRELDSLQPPLFETMKVEAGVVLHEGEFAKEGPRRADYGTRMSRKEYASLAAMEGIGDIQPVTGTEGDMLLSEEASMILGQMQPSQMSAMQMMGQDPSMLSQSTGAGYDPAMLKGHGGIRVPGPDDDFNMSILNAADWGSNPVPRDYNPPSPPVKAGPGDRIAALGERHRLPRERPHMHAGPKSRLPPPVYPAKHGHGLMTSYLASENAYHALANTSAPKSSTTRAYEVGDQPVTFPAINPLPSSGSALVNNPPLEGVSSLGNSPTYKKDFTSVKAAATMRTANPKLLEELLKDSSTE